MSDLPLRPELVGRSPYGAPQIDVPIRLNTNENPYPPPPEMIADIAARIARISTATPIGTRSACGPRSPSISSTRPACGCRWTRCGRPTDPTRSCSRSCRRSAAGRTALGFQPGYTMHELISRGTGTAFLGVPGSAPDADHVVAAVREHRPDVLFLCSPNNPTGESLPPDVINAAYQALAETDPASWWWMRRMRSSPASTVRWVARGSAAATGDTHQSKAFAFAGARVGYLAADPAVVEALLLVRLPYHRRR